MPRRRNSTCPCADCNRGITVELHHRWLSVLGTLNERQARLYAAEKALELGHGGVAYLSIITGLHRHTITKGIRELESGIVAEDAYCIRQAGGGRKPIECAEPQLLSELESIMEESTGGDPMSALRWINKSTRRLAKELTERGYTVSHETVCRLLHDLDYSLRGNVKSLSRGDHPQRDAQFRAINRLVKRFQRAKNPVISVDTKKKEKVGEFRNPGRRWSRKAKHVNAYDFPHLAEGKAIPYGVYDVGRNAGMVRVGITRDTAEFAVDTIIRWWTAVGRRVYPDAKKILICADGGGSNGSRNRLWKVCLQNFADKSRLTVTVCHYPPGTSKWNKIEHRMFSYITLNWQGEPLSSYETVIGLINGTSTATGLKIRAELTTKEYEKGIKVSAEELDELKLTRHKTNPDWNYSIAPRRQ